MESASWRLGSKLCGICLHLLSNSRYRPLAINLEPQTTGLQALSLSLKPKPQTPGLDALSLSLNPKPQTPGLDALSLSTCSVGSWRLSTLTKIRWDLGFGKMELELEQTLTKGRQTLSTHHHSQPSNRALARLPRAVSPTSPLLLLRRP